MKHLHMIGLTLAAALFAGQANAEDPAGTLKNIKETGAITLGYRDSSIPFSYLDDDQKPIGFAMDICYKIVDAVKAELKLSKLEVKLNPVTSATRIPLLANGTIDLECGSTTNNAERQKQISFTNTHFLTASRFVSKKSNKLNMIDDLKGKSVVSTAGTTNIKQLTEANAARSLGVNIITGQGPRRSVPDGRDRSRGRLRDGRHPAGQPRCRLERTRVPMSISTDAFSKPEPYGIMLRKDDAAFKKVVDGATAALYTSGEGQKLYDKWFMAEDPAEGPQPQHPDRTRTEAANSPSRRIRRIRIPTRRCRLCEPTLECCNIREPASAGAGSHSVKLPPASLMTIGVKSPHEDQSNEAMRDAIAPMLADRLLCRAGARRGADGDAEENQGNRCDHARLPRVVDSVFLSRRQSEADRLCDRHLLQDRRRREERAPSSTSSRSKLAIR